MTLAPLRVGAIVRNTYTSIPRRPKRRWTVLPGRMGRTWVTNRPGAPQTLGHWGRRPGMGCGLTKLSRWWRPVCMSHAQRRSNRAAAGAVDPIPSYYTAARRCLSISEHLKYPPSSSSATSVTVDDCSSTSTLPSAPALSTSEAQTRHSDPDYMTRMSIEPVRRKRAFLPKVKTGCKTCKYALLNASTSALVVQSQTLIVRQIAQGEV